MANSKLLIEGVKGAGIAVAGEIATEMLHLPFLNDMSFLSGYSNIELILYGSALFFALMKKQYAFGAGLVVGTFGYEKIADMTIRQPVAVVGKNG